MFVNIPFYPHMIFQPLTLNNFTLKLSNKEFKHKTSPQVAAIKYSVYSFKIFISFGFSDTTIV